MKLSVIMPCYNEEKTVAIILNKVKKLKINKEIIIVDDGSTDNTLNIIKKLKDKNIKIIRHEKNLGRGTAIREALKHITGDIIILQDADLEYDPNDYYKIIKPIIKGESSIVFCSIYMENKKFSMSKYLICTKILNFLAMIMYGAELTDESTCYKAFKTDVIRKINLKSKRFEFCPEFTAKVSKLGYKIKEVPISYNPRNIKDGKKVKYKDGLEAIYTIIKYRFFN